MRKEFLALAPLVSKLNTLNTALLDPSNTTGIDPKEIQRTALELATRLDDINTDGFDLANIEAFANLRDMVFHVAFFQGLHMTGRTHVYKAALAMMGTPNKIFEEIS